MLDNQYSLFRDLDRRCGTSGLKEGQCLEAVRLKRASIESDRFRDNAVVREVLDGATTFVSVYDSYSRMFRGLRRFVPHRHDSAHNERLELLGAIVPNVRHFTRRSVFAMDNPVAGIAYGLMASFGIAVVWAHSTREDGEGASIVESLGDDMVGTLFLVFGFAGFVVGAAAMLKYRTRDYHVIHAREAAAYMDLNYAYYRMGDDAAWVRFIQSQGTVGVPIRSPEKNVVRSPRKPAAR